MDSADSGRGEVFGVRCLGHMIMRGHMEGGRRPGFMQGLLYRWFGVFLCWESPKFGDVI